MAMRTVDYIYRYDPEHRGEESVPVSPAAAREELERGNRLFTDWVESCRTRTVSRDGPRYVLNCNHLGEVMAWDPGAVPRHQPFAIVVGCSDARVPVEMIFGQSLSELFVVRVAGNVLDAVAQGSVDYALDHLATNLQAVVIIGHGGCGAVTAAVDAYLNPQIYWTDEVSHPIRSIIRRLMLTVHEAAKLLEDAHGPEVEALPGYRPALIKLSVCLNAAQGAYDLRHSIEAHRRPIEAYFGVYNLRSGRVGLPFDFDPDRPGLTSPGLRDAPRSPREFHSLGGELARGLKTLLLTVPAGAGHGARHA